MADTATEKKAVKPQPKKRTGKVTSDKMEKTIVVSIDRLVKHRLYKKYIRRSKKLYVHDEARTAKVGDTVEVAEVTRPLSKLKRWRLVRIVERAK
ncbi:MAG TPA: 30S ribosomal protein S17 [Candidatus Sumerlaeota bacterium]|nr:30S ribosomal protein S17 [Candidatus Sumerlaeota bacterium]HMZ51657.1 30S ribosomal protein S17 [Candidatus Sumerlaeota bacterium]HNM46590.1 30S ribosomal protein S17 [Candidatus Sumerlaeota bacterium]